MTHTIELGNAVYISDPCVNNPSPCSKLLTNVLPGEWITTINYDEIHGSNKNAELIAMHKDHQGSRMTWDWAAEIAVDSGQAGIFDAETYKDDSTVVNMVLPVVDFVLPDNASGPGLEWYKAMCKITLGSDGNWGGYDRGVVSRSGYGDDMYPIYTAKDLQGHIIGMMIVFIDQDSEDDEEDLWSSGSLLEEEEDI